jgi:hypothetical protein
MAKTLQQELDEYRRLLSIFRKLYAEDGTITPDEQSHLDVLEGKIKQLSSVAMPNAGNGNGKPYTPFSVPTQNTRSDGGLGMPGGPSQERVIAQADLKAEPSATDQTTYENNLRGIEAKLQQILKENPPDAKSREIHEKVKNLDAQMRATASDGDYHLANQLSEELLDEMGKYERSRDAAKKSVSQRDAAKATYEQKLARIEAELQKVIHETPPDADASQILDEISRAKEQMDSAVSQADFAQANVHLDKIISELAKYRQIKGTHKSKDDAKAKAAYEANLKSIKSDFDTLTFRSIDRNEPLAWKRQKLFDLKARLDDALATSTTNDAGNKQAKEPDYVAANKIVDELRKAIADYKADPYWKDNYEKYAAQIKGHLKMLTQDEWWNAAVTKAERQQVEAASKGIDDPAVKKDYYQGVLKLREIDQKIHAFRSASGKQLNAKAQFMSGWTIIKNDLPQIVAAKPDNPAVEKLHGQIKTLDEQMKSMLRRGDYVEAVKPLSQLETLVPAYRKTEKESPKYRFDADFAKIRVALDEALSLYAWLTAPDMLKQQYDIKAKKGEMEGAVAKKDYAQALKHLEDLTKLVGTFTHELRKSPQTCAWVSGTVQWIDMNLDAYYLDAESRLNDAAKAYKDALANHREVLRKEQSFAEEFLKNLLFAGLFGAAGGAIGATVKKLFGEAKDSAVAGAIVTATSDITKFAVAGVREYGKRDLKDPLAGLTPLKGDGVDLLLSVGARLKEEAAKLKRANSELVLLLRGDNCAKHGSDSLRVLGDPAESLKNDPFLKIMGSIEADIRTYSRLIWIEWGKHNSDKDVWDRIKDIRKQAGEIRELEERYQAYQKKQKESAERRMK